MNHEERFTYWAALTALLAALSENGTEATILYGPRASGKSSLLDDLLITDQLAESFIPISLNVRNNLGRSRADVITSLAAALVEATGQTGSLLNDFAPNRFHNEFLTQVLQAIPPSQKLLIIFDDIDLADRTQLSKLNNLVLPLLRRLAHRERLKFVLAIDDVTSDKLRMLVQPIFAEIREVELTKPIQPVAIEQLHQTAAPVQEAVRSLARAPVEQDFEPHAQQIALVRNGKYSRSGKQRVTPQIEDQFEPSVESRINSYYPYDIDRDAQEPQIGQDSTLIEMALLIVLLSLIILILFFNIWRFLSVPI